MASVHLNDIPDSGPDLENYVAALFQSAGYYVEKNLVQRDPDDVLELDIVATDYSSTSPAYTLAEAKGGAWGHADIFKVVGWMHYLNQDRAVFFVKNEPGNIAKVNERVNPLGATVVCFGDFQDPLDRFQAAGLGKPYGAELVSLWRHSYQIERRLAKLVLAKAKSDSDREGPKAALDYHRLINDGIFFAQSTVESLQMLYAAYQKHPKLTLACALEMDGAEFDPHAASTQSPRIQEVLWEGKHPFLQACMYMEHRARLALLRGAIDLCCQDPATSGVTLRGAGLPATFCAGFEWLKVQPTFYRYALFWQQFLWGWGGFYLTDHLEQEIEWMARYSGIPQDEILSALEAFDRFFPRGGDSWFVMPGDTCARQVLLTPMLFQGIGAHHRLQQYELDSTLSGLTTSGWTKTDIARWNNCTVAFLA